MKHLSTWTVKAKTIGLASAFCALGLALAPISAMAQDKISLILHPVAAFEPVFLAQEQGIFEKYDLEIGNMARGGSPDQQVAQLLGGQVQFAMGSGTSLIVGGSRNVPVAGVLGINQIEEPASAGLVVVKDSPIQSVADLQGKSVGIPGLGSGPHIALKISLEDHGVDPESVNYVNVPFDALMETANRGAVDAIFPTSVFYTSALQSGFRLVELSTIDYMRGVPQVTWIASKDFIAANPDIVERFQQAMLEAYAYANAHPDEVRRIDHENTPLPAAFIDSYEIPEFKGEFDRAAIEKAMDDIYRLGFVPAKASLDAFMSDIAPYE